MKSIMCAALALGLSLPVTAGDDPVALVSELFDGMRAGDGDAIRAMVLPGAKLDRLKKDGTIHQGTFEKWAAWVDTLEPGQADEQVFGVKILQASDDLATVWAPFQVSFDGEMVGCGVNQFTMARSEGGWKILYGIDQPTGEDCTKFRRQIEGQ
ncbi:nuclear transport factor 2 family protein [Kordiimonas lipolytica]|uniref:Nuclear transport factor 2 family protein n=1 Tax=Kordiimonas lipolytica TaxID=1662421 RepID=A0ABV8UBB4_9PROT|nr:nuclear transport factor 2 family protein [Kordiimonas lipolytica]